MLEKDSKTIAKESLKTKKARKKLKKQMDEVEKKMTPEALKEKIAEIHRWIARHAHQRVVLKDKNISLFDGNQNAASLSQKIRKIAKNLQSDMQSWPQSTENSNLEKLNQIFIKKQISDSTSV